MKIDTSSVKKWTILQIEGKLFRVTDIGHTHVARGGATYNFKVKDVITGKTNQFTYHSGTALDQADITTKNATFLYKGADSYTFMENDSGEMHDVPEETIEDIVPYFKEGLECFLMNHEGNIVSVILPATISYTIESTVPGLKGDRSTAGKKPATLENGVEVQVPLHKEAGQTVTVNTLTGEAS